MGRDSVAVREDAAISAARRQRPLPRIVIFGRWCKGCGICSAVCPTHAIEADAEGRPTVLHPERCTACQMCVIHCPDLAITVTLPKDEE